MADGTRSAYDVLHAFERWPTWLWANREVETLIEWMRGWNEHRPPETWPTGM